MKNSMRRCFPPKVQFFVVHPEMQLLDAGSRRYYYLSIKNKLAKTRFISTFQELKYLLLPAIASFGHGR